VRPKSEKPLLNIPNADLRTNYLRWQSVIEYLAPQYCLIIAGMIQRESAWEPKAERYEGSFFTQIEDKEDWQRRIEENGWQICHVCSSLGLMQIWFVVAWERGFHGSPTDLLVPETNLVYGTMQLKWLLDRLGVTGLNDAVAAYNAGSPKLDATGAYVNQEYVDYVFSVADQLKEILGRRTYGQSPPLP